MAFLTPEDLEPFATIDLVKAQAMIDDATATAVLAAPCLADEDELTDHQKAATKAVLRGAILRWNDAGSGALTQQSAGPFAQSIDTRNGERRGMFIPSEIESLQDICKGEDDGGAFHVDTVPSCTIVHADICSINFGATYCSCGAVLTGLFPLWEQPC